VVPGDQVIFHLDLIKRKRDMWKVKGVAKVEGRTAMEGVFLAVVSEKADSLGEDI
jgi:3-hydroxymyristoyl/3-hydroxydecanoyl-(acyl carrier protein) dehydratase